jgi:hypothetical protein
LTPAQLNQKERLQQTELGAYVSPLSAEKLEEEQNMVGVCQHSLLLSVSSTTQAALCF